MNGRSVLPCQACGIAVREWREPEDIEELTFADAGIVTIREVTWCGPCGSVRDAARDLLRAHPEVRSAIGDKTVAQWRLECALSALEVLGIRDAAVIDRLTRSRTELNRLIDVMFVPGAVARWTHGLSFMRPAKADTFPPSGSPWSHVTEEQRQELRDAAAALMRSRVEKPTPIAAPSANGRPTGCLLCGVAAWEALPSAAERVWTEDSSDPAALGGAGSAEYVEGVTCPRCSFAIEAEHSVGQSAMRHSLLDYLGLKDWVHTPVDLSVVAWGVTGFQPNQTPWAHLNLDALTARLADLGMHGTYRSLVAVSQ